MRVLIASANPWSFALAVERQMARKHQDDEVDLLDLWSLSGRFSPHWSPRDRVIERANRKIERFIKPVINGRDITRSVTPRAPVPDSPRDVTNLRHYRVGDVPVGLAVLSSVFELTSIQDARVASEYGTAFDEAWHSAHRSLQIGQAVEQLGYDRVYIFGGRHCYSRPFIECVSRKSEVLRYEQGGTGTSYLMAAKSLYEPLNLATLIASFPLDEEAGEQWFKERLSRSAAWDAGFFTGTQKRGRIPEGLGDRPFVTFFNTSVDEFYAIRDEVRFGDYATQGDAALAMARICRDEGKDFAVRFHPHLKFKHPSWRNEWNTQALKDLGAILVEPDDPTDTYALAQASESVLSCGSTISFECSFLEKANAVLGDGLAAGMGAAPIVRTEEDLRQFIRAPHLSADARRNALKLGSFYKNGATPMEGQDPGSHPNFARIDGSIVDPFRYALQRVRETMAGLSGKKAENRSGIVEGRVALPSGARYRTR